MDGDRVATLEEMSKILVEVLGLKYDPVAITLIKKGQQAPEGYGQPDKPIRHCQAIMRARHGESLLVPLDKQACPVGASSLGIVPIPEKVESGEFHYNLGMYSSQEAARNMIRQRPALETGSVIAVALSPLAKARIEPDVVVVIGTPEQIYWLLPAATTFSVGGRITVEMASMQASCADSTVLPYITGKVNISLGCFGCRKTTDIAPEHMLVGIPMSKMEDIVEAVKKMGEGPIPKSRVKVM
ncbi:MAG: DUF169 domain-containing protein [Methanomassiliicoccales archaeon]|nr:DUF169 domain-containing protein [Methanomassiliicoccales archaeon]